MDRRQHWDQVYRSKGDGEVSWTQSDPRLSLALIAEVAPTGGVIDAGGGPSPALPGVRSGLRRARRGKLGAAPDGLGVDAGLLARGVGGAWRGRRAKKNFRPTPGPAGTWEAGRFFA